jgi:hypothetical protein
MLTALRARDVSRVSRGILLLSGLTLVVIVAVLVISIQTAADDTEPAVAMPALIIEPKTVANHRFMEMNALPDTVAPVNALHDRFLEINTLPGDEQQHVPYPAGLPGQRH